MVNSAGVAWPLADACGLESKKMCICSGLAVQTAAKQVVSRRLGAGKGACGLALGPQDWYPVKTPAETARALELSGQSTSWCCLQLTSMQTRMRFARIQSSALESRPSKAIDRSQGLQASAACLPATRQAVRCRNEIHSFPSSGNTHIRLPSLSLPVGPEQLGTRMAGSSAARSVSPACGD
jgi:hypothetical protein